MKALTVRQPWASLIAAGVKSIETRSWSTSYRGPLAIHAGKARPPCTQWEEGPFDDIGEGDLIHQYGGWVDENTGHLLDDPWWLTLAPEHRDYVRMPLGAAVATCTLSAVVPICRSTEPPPDWREWGAPSPWVGVHDGGAFLYRRPPVHGSAGEYVTNQVPFGDFTPGRFAWLLEDITPLADPVSAKGRQGLWELDLEAAA